MLFTAQQLTYRATGKFSKIVLDYLEGREALNPFYAYEPTIDGIRKAINAKQKQPQNRTVLVDVLKQQYASVETNIEVTDNINALLSDYTFTICTAHQPNLFTGPLYFIYKILHAIKLAESCKRHFPEYTFVPVYYMGSEDADKEELNHTYINGKKYAWETAQSGAVGRMKVDAALIKTIAEIKGQLEVLPFGADFIQLLEKSYTKDKSIQQATFEVVHELFKKFGLIVLIPDHAELKKIMRPIFEKDLFDQSPSVLVESTCEQLGAHYDVQATPRAINLFYLKEGIRNRIVQLGDEFVVHETSIRFTKTELIEELDHFPERFSPNVILRGLFQETILPNIAFIGGGGELAYWLQLRGLFEHFSVPFPVLVLRNSFLIIEKKWNERLLKWNLSTEALFKSEFHIVNQLLEQEGKLPQLNGEIAKLENIYEDLKKFASGVDASLDKHVEALKVRSLFQLEKLEKKMMRAERKKHVALQNQVKTFKQTYFPKEGLQERFENIGSFYSKWGPAFLDDLLHRSLSLEQQFTILHEA